MRTKKIGYLLSVLLLFPAFMCTVGASSDITASFRGGGVTIDLTFPEEAHPLDNIVHDLTINSNTDIILQNFTVSIKAPVNSGWQEIRKREEIGQNLSKNTPWTVPLSMSLPQDTNGTLSCFIYVLTNQTTEPLVYTLFTTHVSKLTFSEMQSLYNEMLANYTSLQADYDELNQKYNNLLDDLSNLQGRISNSESALNNDRIVMFIFVITLVALIAFIIYLKRGKEEPYVVIRKETVSMNQDEDS